MTQKNGARRPLEPCTQFPPVVAASTACSARQSQALIEVHGCRLRSFATCVGARQPPPCSQDTELLHHHEGLPTPPLAHTRALLVSCCPNPWKPRLCFLSLHCPHFERVIWGQSHTLAPWAPTFLMAWCPGDLAKELCGCFYGCTMGI